ncbi:MAG: hypothetical protein HKN14_06375 [Marinicaulis sp.]|nr:hypothetical protein [Marinicaulis sp.]NNE40527.1 hypothetical protein [Marinicaulis sp.]NNL87797.1 hypothetical protein [Marinicaulis sp.]
MTKDLRKEQLTLLRFEKQIAGLAATLAAGVAVAKTADGKLHATEAQTALADVQTALINLAEVTGKAHDALNVKVIEAGAKVYEASGGVPKGDPPKVVASILGIG